MRASLQRWIATMVLCVQALIAAATGESVTHVVRPGDTLSAIAQKYYGAARRWNRIVAANPALDPRRLRVGQKLVIPVGDAPAPPPSVVAPPPSGPAGDGTRHAGPAPSVAAAPPIQPLTPALAPLDSAALRRLAAAAAVKHYQDLDLAEYDPGYLVRLEAPTPASGARVVVSWLGRETLALEKRATPELDRKQVLKIEVWLTEDGQVLKITDRPVWLNRNVRDAAVQ